MGNHAKYLETLYEISNKEISDIKNAGILLEKMKIVSQKIKTNRENYLSKIPETYQKEIPESEYNETKSLYDEYNSLLVELNKIEISY